MTEYFCDTGGSNTSPYDTWEKAATTLAAALAVADGGDIIYLKQNNGESYTSSQTLTSPGDVTEPIYIISATGSGTSVTYAKSTSYQFRAINANVDIIFSGAFNFEGCWFEAGDDISFNEVYSYDSYFLVGETTTSSFITLVAKRETNWINTDIERSASSLGSIINGLSGDQHSFHMFGGSVSGSNASVTSLAVTDGVTIRCYGVDFSGAGGAVVNVGAVGIFEADVKIIGAKLASGQAVFSNTAYDNCEYINRHSSDSDNLYTFETRLPYVTVLTETTTTRDSGAEIDSQAISLGIETVSGLSRTAAKPIHVGTVNVDASGTKTFTVEFVQVNADTTTPTALKDSEIYIEVLAKTNGAKGYTFLTDFANLIDEASQASSSVTWSGIGSYYLKQKCSVQASVGEGPADVYIRLVKHITDELYVCPKVDVS